MEAEAAQLRSEKESLEKRLQNSARESSQKIAEIEDQVRREARVVEEKLRKAVASLEEQLEKAIAAEALANEVLLLVFSMFIEVLSLSLSLGDSSYTYLLSISAPQRTCSASRRRPTSCAPRSTPCVQSMTTL